MGTVKYSGPVASFHCPTKATIRSLKVHFSPKQLGEGTPSPENVREIVGWDACKAYKCGKNIGKVRGYSATGIPTNDSARNLTNSYGTTLSTVDYNLPDTSLVITQSQAPDTATKANYKNGYICVILDDLVFDETYKFSFKVTKIVNNPLNAILSNLKGMSPYGTQITPQIINDNIVCFTVPFKAGPRGDNYKAFELRTCGMSFTMSEFMVTTVDVEDRTFEPYHGETVDYEFGVLGKNKVPWISPDGFIMEKAYNGNSGWSTPWAVPKNANGMNITYSADIDNTNGAASAYLHIWTKDENDNFVDTTISSASLDIGSSGRLSKTITLNTDRYSYVMFGLTMNNATASHPMVELGSTATAYEPYYPNKTVYGGWVDLVSGEVCETWKGCKGKNLQWENSTMSYSHFKTTIPYLARFANTGDPSVISSYYRGIPWQITPPDNYIVVRHDGYTITVYDKTHNDTGLEALIQDLAEQDFVYELATPIVYSLAPISMQTFLSQNNVWSNADYVEVEYDLHETQDILARKQFIVANQPHVEKLAAAPLQNFVTDMVAPIKECKVYFEPVQEGSGDPSPDNVRPISGWNGIMLQNSNNNINLVRTQNNLVNLTYRGLLINISESGRHFKIQNTVTATFNLNLLSITSMGGYIYITGFPKLTNNSMWRVRKGDEELLVNNDINGFSYYTENNDLISIGINMTEGDSFDLDFYPVALYLPPITISWQTEAGTIYGGYVDLTAGDLVQTYIHYNLGDLEATTYGASSYDGAAGTNVLYYIQKTGTGIGYPTSNLAGYSDKLKNAGKNVSGYWIGTWSDPDAHIWEYCFNASEQLHVVYDNETVGVTSDMSFAQRRQTITAWLQGNPITIVAPLATPIHYSLTPTQLKTLRGTNNIWSNAGNIELSYWKH